VASRLLKYALLSSSPRASRRKALPAS